MFWCGLLKDPFFHHLLYICNFVSDTGETGMMPHRMVAMLAVAAMLMASLPQMSCATESGPAIPTIQSDMPSLPDLPRISTGPREAPALPFGMDSDRVEAISATAIGPLGERLAGARGPTGRAADLTLTGSDILLVDNDLSVLNINMSGNSILFVYNVSRTVQLTMAGSLTLRDNATFVLNHSKLLVDQSYDQQFMMQMHNMSRFFAFFSNVTTSGFQWPGAMWDRSNLTIGGTEFCVNPSWFPVTLIQNASIYSAYSLFYSDIVHFDFPWVPLGSSIVLDHSAYFNIWLAVKTGASADLTLPPTFAPVPVNWSFPGTFAVTNIDYRIELNVSSPLLFATMQYRGSSIIVRDSPSFLGAFFIDNAATAFSGMREQKYVDTTFPMQDLSLRLVNSTIYTWNFYASDGADITIDSSDVGEILCMGTGQATIRNSNLNGKGGYVSCHDTSRLMIFNSTISPVVVSYQNTVLEIQNTTIDFWWPTRVLASGSSLLKLTDVTLGKNVTLEALESGRLETYYHLDVTVNKSGSPAAGASIEARYRSINTLAGNAVAGPGGSASFLLRERALSPGVTTFTNNYTISAFRNSSLASKDHTLKARETLTLELLDFVSGTSPADGEKNVSLSSHITINFSYVMEPLSSLDYIAILPNISVAWSWDTTTSLGIVPSVNLAPVSNYTVTVSTEAKTLGGLQLPEPFSFTFTTGAQMPDAPSNLVAEAGNRSVRLRWNAPVHDGGAPVEGYRLYRGAGNSTAEFLAATNLTEYLDVNLTQGTMYYYSVSARNIAGEGPLSALAMATPGTVPTAPRRLNVSSGNKMVALGWLAPEDSGGFAITQYSVYRGSSPANISLLTRLGAVLNFTDANVTNGMTYYYRVSASNERGEGPPCLELNATPRSPNTVPGKPQNLTAASSDHKVTLCWSAPESDGGLPVTGYRIYRSNTSADFRFLRSVAVNSTIDEGLSNQKSYFYRVSAVNDIGEGPLSEMASALPLALPSAPQNLTLAAKGGKVLLKWDPPADDGGSQIRSYRVYRGAGPQNMTVLSLAGASTTTFVDSNASAGKRYYYKVAAVCDDGEGAPSPVSDISVPKTAPVQNGPMVPVLFVAIVAVAGAVGAVLLLRSRRKGPPK